MGEREKEKEREGEREWEIDRERERNIQKDIEDQTKKLVNNLPLCMVKTKRFQLMV